MCIHWLVKSHLQISAEWHTNKVREVQSPEIEHRLLGRPELKEKENINKSAQINFFTCNFACRFVT